MATNQPTIRTPNNFDLKSNSDQSALICEDESLTLQSEADDADINKIVAKFIKTGEIPSGGLAVPTYGDFTSIVTDYKSALDLLAESSEQFDLLPATLRERFENNPALLLDFLEDPENRPEAERLGLVVPQKTSLKDEAKPNTENASGAAAEAN